MYDIVIGIPSYNEGSNISFVAEQLDLGLQKYYQGKKAVIVNVDGGSTDNTKECFLNTETKTEKKHLCKKGVNGKGNVLKILFEFVKENQAEAVMIVDADLRSINPEWVKHMLEPIFNGYDYCTPLYSRHKYDGTITNHIVYPLIYGLFGIDIRQPIGGDFSFSGKIVEYWLSQQWSESTGQFGIDNFMTTCAITGGFKICQVGLGAKIHKPSAPNLGKMFIEVVDTFFNDIFKSKDFISNVSEIKKTEIFGIGLGEPQELEVDKHEIREKALEGMKKFENLYKELGIEVSKNINAEKWCTIVYSFLNNFRKEYKNKVKIFSKILFQMSSNKEFILLGNDYSGIFLNSA